MRKRLEPTVVEKAIEAIPGFNAVFLKLQQQVVLRGQSKSTLDNYIWRIAQISIHFFRLPEQVSDDEINEYLASLALSVKSPSRSNFKHAVYGFAITSA
jgi:integrase/recombinase XerD